MAIVKAVHTPDGDYWDVSLGGVEAATVLAVLNRIGGPPRGPRGLTDRIKVALIEAGVQPRTDIVFRGDMYLDPTSR